MPDRPSNALARFCCAAAVLAAVLAAGCARTPASREPFDVREITPGFLLAGSASDPAVAADARGNVAVSWVARAGTLSEVWLAVSRDSGGTFSPPVRVSAPGSQVVSSAEGRPAVALGPGGALAIAWSERRADSSWAVDLRVRASADLGHTLGGITTVNDDAAGMPAGLRWRQRRDWVRDHRPDALHGFPALLFLSDGALLAAWLDDRRSPDPVRRATLWSATSLDGGQSWSPNVAVSDSACPGCRPTLARGEGGAVALGYRDATSDQLDPRLALSTDGGRVFRDGLPLARDGWRTSASPEQGAPVVWDRPEGGSCVWFTGAQPPGIYIVRWRREGGVAGLKRAAADSLSDGSRPVVAAWGDGVLVGIESRAAIAPYRTFAVRALDAGGNWSPYTYLGADIATGTLASQSPGRAVAAWVEREPGRGRLRLATLTRRVGMRS